MNIGEAFPSAFLKAADLQGKTVKVTISEFELIEFDNEGKKPVIKFVGKDSGLVLNKTRANTLRGIFGDETDNWIGKELVLSTVKVPFQGKMTDSIAVAAVPTPEPTERTDDDDVPF